MFVSKLITNFTTFLSPKLPTICQLVGEDNNYQNILYVSGYFHVEGHMYCEPHAKEVSVPEGGQDMYAVPVYR